MLLITERAAHNFIAGVLRGSCIKMIKTAFKFAQKSDHQQFKHAAIVLKGGAVLAFGFNHEKVHAEVNALKKLWPNKRKGTTVISLRFTKSGFGNSRPCPHCSKFMKENGVKKFVYTVALPEKHITVTERI